jgi:hypothetical protein
MHHLRRILHIRTGPFAQRAVQHRALIFGVGAVGGLTKGMDTLAIGLQHRGIHPVQRGARHRTQRPDRAGLAAWLQHSLFLHLKPPYTCRATKPWTSDMTYHPKSEFMSVMIERGYLADCTDYQGLDEAL